MAPTTPHHAFGRRGDPKNAAVRTMPTPATDCAPLPDDFRWTNPADPELDDWKRTRRWQPPWRQISLMASLCFGIASLVLPDTVNDTVQWLLYALTAVSLYGGLRKRWK
jgi:hypothetical protein